jgi:fluoroquinolone transport system permease protein
MQMTQLLRKVGPVDVKVIRRDSFLLFMFSYTTFMALLLRLLLPRLNVTLAANGVLPNERFAVELSAFYPMIVAYVALYSGALAVGMIFGFMLLDEKDDQTLTAMLVTPVPLRQYALYRVGVAAALAFVIIWLMLLIIGQALLPFWQLLLCAAGAALTAPIIVLFFAIIAENKVQGFAYGKFGGIAGFTILLGWFVPEPLQWLFGLFPPFWVSKAFWLAHEGRGLWWVALFVGIVLQIGLIGWLLQRFTRAVYR